MTNRSSLAYFCARALSLTLPTLVVFGPFISASPGSSGQLYGYRAALLLLAVALPFYVKRGHYTLSIPFKLFYFFAFVWTFWGSFATTWSPAADNGYRYLTGSLIAIYGGILVTIFISSSMRLLTDFLTGWILSLILMFATNVWELRTGTALVERYAGIAWKWEGVIGGPFQNPNMLAGYFLLSTCILCWRIYETKRTAIRLPYIMILGATLFATTYTASRTAIAGCAAVTVVSLLYFLAKSPAYGGSQSGTALIVGIILLVAYFAGLFDSLTGEVNTLFAAKHASDAYRRLSFEFGSEMLLQPTGLLGYGAGAFTPLMSQWLTHKFGGGKASDAHNAFTEIGVNFGWLTLVPFLFLIGSLLLMSFFREHKSTRPSIYFLASIMSLSLLFVSNAAGSSNTLPYWWAALGFSVALFNTAERDSRQIEKSASN